ncbi:MAG: ATP-binding protein [Thermoplasmata archaeon M9B1D]|nr:MAG: ATP-binding protein [Thermoplasmata archaeon M8B2D]PNX49702.1 MAG: ATP-binding protein [Thermoplasmata archaeon M9B1D]
MKDETTIKLNLEKNLKKIKHKIIVLSGKGGVGKSTISANLAVMLADKGYKVGILDSDLHGPSIPKLLGIETKKPMVTDTGIQPVFAMPNLEVMSIAFLLQDKDSPVIWRGPLKMGAIKQLIGGVEWGNLDYLIVDLPPGTGDEPLSILQIIKDNDGAIIVTTPQDVALLSVRKSINFVRKMNVPVIGIIENMSSFTCPHCNRTINIFKTGGGLKASMDLNVPFLGNIPLDPEIVEKGDLGITIFSKNKKSATMNAFIGIIKKIEEKNK